MATTKSVDGQLSGNVYIDSLIWGGRVWDQTVPIKVWLGDPDEYNSALAGGGRNFYEGYFGIEPGAQAPTLNVNTLTFWQTQAEVNAFIYALSLYESVCDLQFDIESEYTIEQADIVWWRVDSNDIGALAIHENLASIPNTVGQVWGYFNYAATESWSQLSLGGDGLSTIVHEIGHGLGLAHPHDGGRQDDKNTFPGVVDGSTGTFGLNQSVYTAMSYNSGLAGTPRTFVYGNQAGLGAFDIAALQWIYGANTTTKTGDDIYALPTSNAVGTGWSCIWDAGGDDTISGMDATSSVTIDLRPATLAEHDPHAGGFISAQVGIGGGFTIASNVTIENAYGGRYADKLYGNGAGNRMLGNSGTDSLYGFDGDDILIGGTGNDKLYGGTGKDVFVFNTSLSATGNKDTIGDWNGLYDMIELDSDVFTKLTRTGVLNKANFVIGSAKDSNDYIGYDRGTGNLWYDRNGSAAGGQVVFANIGKNKAIGFADFVVI
ncbi:hypothetical protein DC522_00320 [Microvirga sp. KLBC 81]|uniref:M10 family metallopeptidase C-terminal domain-containing protein n=1 Tax=Microvirga sp. KLBC 81 TaxID=1862707 RepID=UPI000D506087|nr:M10 family metallopeptidase C-terminal domain-containing protein [Microvirga sp. KLBC 81]PVE26245.1 hypothetical protein DC522_00320 [Microvirga sp. KLBC 81]